MYVLYVDDNEITRHELEEGFEFVAPDWEMRVADSLEAAEHIVNSTNSLDAVVTRSRVEHIDMDPLLMQVSDVHPGAIRIMVEDMVHTQDIFQPSSLAHQYMLAPVDHVKLRDTLQRIRGLQLDTTAAKIQHIIGRIGKLPSLPALYAEISEEIQSPATTVQEVGEIIAKDVAMTTKILQLANSPVFGFTSRIMDISHAVFVLGLDTIKGLVLSAGLFSNVTVSRASGVNPERFMDHSTKVALLARSIAISENKSIDFTDISYIGGFLHDIGRLVLASQLSEEYGHAHALAEERKIPLIEAEVEVFGADHAEVGGCLLGLWGFPDQVSESAFRHHAPIASIDTDFTPLTAVHTANVIIERRSGPGLDGNLAEVDAEYMARINCLDRVDTWKGIIALS